MIEIPLTQGKVAIVDDCDAHLADLSWHAIRRPRGIWYAGRTDQRNERLHRVILGVTDPKVQVDHRNGDGLDCRRGNLRASTVRQNQGNAPLRRDNTSGFKGVYWQHRTRKWAARIRAGGRTSQHLGLFSVPEDAARAYDEAARSAFGAFACTNFPRNGERPARPNVVTASPSTPETKDDR